MDGKTYGRERERYYNRNSWGVMAVDSMAREERNLGIKLRGREKEV